MRSRQLATLCAFAALWICAFAQAASVRAWLDRSTMQLGETVTLNVQVEGKTQAQQPDFSALAQDFDMTGTQNSTSVNIVNGVTTSSVLWAVGLSPKHAGTFTIPALSVAGQQTQPLKLTVSPPSAHATQPGGDVFVQAQVDPVAPYVQQQVLLTVKLYYAVNLIDGNLGDPQIKGAFVRKLGQGSRYRAQMGGRSYNVVERHYALTPENNGVLDVPPIVFRGHAADTNGGGFFFNQGRAISAQSPPLTLNVRPRPAASGNDTWLPARSMALTATGIDANTKAQVGEPLTLTLRIQAQGLGFEQLPKLELPKIDGAEVYPDKPVTQDKNDGQWLYGVRERKFAIVPNRAGTLTMPPISVAWWDTAHDRAATAEIPALTLNVAAATGSMVGPGPSHGANATIAAKDTNVAAAPVMAAQTVAPTPGTHAELHLWRWLAFFALALWALTLTAWIAWLLAARRRGRATQPAPNPVDHRVATARADFRAACGSADWSAAARALLTWARHAKPQLRNLGELARVVTDPAQSAVIGELERAWYGNVAADGMRTRLATAFRNGPSFATAVRVDSTSALPALYPFRG